MRIVILGAGISGLTAAYSLSQSNSCRLDIYEAEPTPGGLCRVFEREGFCFDVVSHVLHFRSLEARQLVHEVLDGNLSQVERNAWIYFRGRYVPYPFQRHIGFLPLPEKVLCLLGYWRAWMGRQFSRNQAPESFEGWIHRNFGKAIGRYFMEPYNTQLWGVPPRGMSVDWVSRFVPRGDLWETTRGFFEKRTTDAGYNSTFYYPPEGGIQALVVRLAQSLSGIHLSKRAQAIDLEKQCIRFEDGEEAAYDQLISTIPLDNFIRQAQGIPEQIRVAATKLRCTTLLNIVFALRRPLSHAYHWVYFPEPEFPFFRLVFPSNICSALAPPGCGLLAAEISNVEKGSQGELEKRTETLLMKLGMVADPASVAFRQCHYLDHAYPVHDFLREQHVNTILGFLRGKNVHSIGRFGSWRYSSIDDAIKEALELSKQILAAA